MRPSGLQAVKITTPGAHAPNANLLGDSEVPPTVHSTAADVTPQVHGQVPELVGATLPETRIVDNEVDIIREDQDGLLAEWREDLRSCHPMREGGMLQGIDLHDQVSVVKAIVRERVLHPLTDRMPRELGAFSSLLHHNLNDGSNQDPFRVLGLGEAISHERGIVSGVVQGLIIGSFNNQEFSSNFALGALATALAESGLKVLADSSWSIFLIKPRSDTAALPWLRLECMPFDAERDLLHFFGFNEPTYTRKFRTISATEHASLDEHGGEIIYTPQTDSRDTSRHFVLSSINKHSPNPHIPTPTFRERLMKLFN